MRLTFYDFFISYIAPRLALGHMLEAGAMIHSYSLLCDILDPWQADQRREAEWAKDFLSHHPTPTIEDIEIMKGRFYNRFAEQVTQ